MAQQLFDIAHDIIKNLDMDAGGITWKCALLADHRSPDYVFDATDTIWNTASSDNPGYWDVTTVTGYSGYALQEPSVTISRSGSTTSFTFAAAPTFTAVNATSPKPNVVAAVIIAYCNIGSGSINYCFSYHDAASSVAINGSNLVYNFTSDIFHSWTS